MITKKSIGKLKVIGRWKKICHVIKKANIKFEIRRDAAHNHAHTKNHLECLQDAEYTHMRAQGEKNTCADITLY